MYSHGNVCSAIPMNTALYTGSFDPVTKGHLDVINTASKMFDRVIVGVGTNPTKKYTFDIQERIDLLVTNILETNVVVMEVPPGKLTADYAYEHKATILKGVRMNATDFDYEWLMADINHAHVYGLKTVILPASPELNSVSSSAAKELCKLNGKVEDFVPLNVKAALERTLVSQKRVIITGTIGCGKSSITQALVNENPDFVHNIDLDVIARDILFDRSEPAYVELREMLQRKFEMDEWTRKELGKVVFGRGAVRAFINDAIRQPLMTRIRSELYQKAGTIIFNGALITEAGWLHLANNNVILLDVNNYYQTLRLKERGYTPEQIQTRVDAQYDTNKKEKVIEHQIKKDRYGKCHRIDTNGVTIDHTVEHVHSIIKAL